MFRVLFFLFIVIPIIEIMVLMQVGALLGTWPTLAIVIASAWLGAKKVREQGIATFSSVQTKVAQGQMPSDEIVTGVLLLVAGVLLVTPGFVTDIFGLSLLVPSLRGMLIKAVREKAMTNNSANGQFHFHHQGPAAHQGEHSSAFDHQASKGEIPLGTEHKGQTIDGEFERKE